MTTTPGFAEIASDLAAWLADQPLAELPPVFRVRLTNPVGLAPLDVDLQLWAGDELAGLAAWAEHLNTTVTVARRSTYVEAVIRARIPGGHGIALWDHLGHAAQNALLGCDLYLPAAKDDTPAVLTASQLRDVIARRDRR
ncbi:hypothetical protein IU422_25500 [Nocardia farcinica]|nr:hypothetical protein [Nocardia farcinica]